MTDILEKITAYKLKEIAAAQAQAPLEAVEAAARKASPVRPFAAALEARISATRFALIGEVKKASPSKGLIRADFEPGNGSVRLWISNRVPHTRRLNASPARPHLGCNLRNAFE